MSESNVLVGNASVTVEIDCRNGSILRMENSRLGINLIQERRLAESFRLLVPLPELRGHYIMGRDQTVNDIQAIGTECTIKWDGLRSDMGSFNIAVTQTLRVQGDDVTVQTTVDNRSGHEIEEIHNVVLGGLRVDPAEREDWRIHHADHVGQGREWAVFDEFPGSYLGPEKPVWIGSYHGDLSMPWVDLYSVKRRVGVYIGNHDEQARQSFVFCELSPCTTYRGDGSQPQRWPEPRHTGDNPVGLALSWASIPFVVDGGAWSGPPIVVHFHDGIWWSAADYFRSWYDENNTQAVSRSWLTDEDAWQSTIISYPDDTIGFRFQDLPALAKAAASCGINVLQLDGWDVGGIDRDYPVYQTDSRLGSRAELAEAIQLCQEVGVRVLLFSNLQWINIETDWYKEELSSYAVRDPRGNIRGGMGWQYNTILGLTNQSIHRMVPANCSRPQFQELILKQLANVVQLGADGTQLDKLGVVKEIDYSPDSPRSRDSAGPAGVLETLSAFISESRAQNPDFAIASEVHWDRTAALVDASYSRFFSTEHLPTFAHTFPEYRQSCCITGEWDFGLVNNCIRYGHIINVEGKCLHGTVDHMPVLGPYIAEVLRLRRSLRDRIWDSRLVDPSSVSLDKAQPVRVSMHESLINGDLSLVMNHFESQSQPVTVTRASAASSGTLYRPFSDPRTVELPFEFTIDSDEVAVLALDRS